jgi:ABC-type branched-subunit amino acid transport system substrate-binding protein
MARREPPEGSAAGAEVAIGTELGGYRIEALLGRGGMGVVYRAYDLALERNVALKLLAPELAEDVRFRERFHRESRLAASLDDPAIVPIYDAGEAADRLYIAMRLVEGTDLKRLLAEEGVLEPERALRLLEQVAEALDAAHERGLVHRDVKPSNVLIDERGHCYLADFGLSRRLGDQTPAVASGRSLGTVDYVAPEQIRGDELDGRADVYSLGCMLYECLAGRPPFGRTSDTAVVFAHLQEEPPALPGLEPVILKALAKEPDDRYQTGRELIDGAREALGLAQPLRSRWPPALAAVAVALIGAALLGFFLTQGGGGVQAEAGADSLVRIDPRTDRIVSTTPVGRKVTGVAASGRYVWVTSFADGTVWRIDAKRRTALKIPVAGSPTGVAAGPGLVLVANGPEHSLTSIDPATGTVRYTTPLTGDVAGTVRVAAGYSGMRFADAAEGIIGQVDIAVKGTAPLNPIDIPRDETSFLSTYQTFSGLAVDQSVWVAGDAFGRSVWRSNPGTSDRVIETVKLPFVPSGIAAGEGSVWVSSSLDDAVWRIDPENAPGPPRGDTLGVRVAVPSGVAGIAVGDGALWVASSSERVVSKIDLRTNRVVARVPMTGSPTSIAVGAGGVWVTTTRPPPEVPRGAIGIGVIADCAGPYAAWYDQSLAGAELPLLHHGGRRAGPNPADGVTGAQIAGKPVVLALACADGTGTSAVVAARRLVEQIGVRIVIGPTFAPEQLALLEYARRRPGVTFLNGTAGAQVLKPPANAFSFSPDGAEYMAGLGAYAYKALGWRRAVIVADLAEGVFNWSQAAGFVAEFCALGGTITKRIWIPPDTQDYSSTVAQIPPRNVDGIVVLTAPEALAALANGYPGLRGEVSRKLLVGTVASDGLQALADRASGIPEGVPWLSVGERRYRYGLELGTHFPARFAYLGAFDISYRDAMAALLEALATAHGDLSGNEHRFMSALAGLTLDSPLGPIRLDASRQAIGRNSLVRFPDNTVVRRVDGVEHTFGGYFSPDDPPPSMTTPVCKRHTPPPWTR